MHVGGHLREAFCDWVEQGMKGKPKIDYEPVEVKWLLVRFWHCSDIMPWMLCNDLEMRHGSTYARAAQRLMAAIAGGRRVSE
jgi:hypothetical protein